MRTRMKSFALIISLSILFFSGCAQKEPIIPVPSAVLVIPEVKDDTPVRNLIVTNALSHLAKKDGNDCSGFVALVNKEALFPFFTAFEIEEHYEDSRRSLAIYNFLSDNNRTFEENPKKGDLIFFANTVKKYSKTKKPDNITHIGIVTHIDEDSTVHFMHNTRGINKVGYLNMNYPTTPLLNGKSINSYMEKCHINSHLCLAPSYFSAYGAIK